MAKKMNGAYKGPVVHITDKVLAARLKCSTDGPDPQADEFPEDTGVVRKSRRRW